MGESMSLSDESYYKAHNTVHKYLTECDLPEENIKEAMSVLFAYLDVKTAAEGISHGFPEEMMYVMVAERTAEVLNKLTECLGLPIYEFIKEFVMWYSMVPNSQDMLLAFSSHMMTNLSSPGMFKVNEDLEREGIPIQTQIRARFLKLRATFMLIGMILCYLGKYSVPIMNLISVNDPEFLAHHARLRDKLKAIAILSDATETIEEASPFPKEGAWESFARNLGASNN